MSTDKPTAAESAQWHREQAKLRHEAAAWTRERHRYAYLAPSNDRFAAHHEAAAEALDLLAELARTYPKTLAMTLTDDHAARLRALVEGR